MKVQVKEEFIFGSYREMIMGNEYCQMARWGSGYISWDEKETYSITF